MKVTTSYCECFKIWGPTDLLALYPAHTWSSVYIKSLVVLAMPEMEAEADFAAIVEVEGANLQSVKQFWMLAVEEIITRALEKLGI